MSFFTKSFHPVTKKWLANVASAGGSVSEELANLKDRLIVRPLVSAGLYNQLIKLNTCDGNNLAASRVPLIDSTNSGNDTAVSMTDADYSQNTGWVTDGSTKYINTGYTPPLSTTSEGMGCYLRTAQASSTTGKCLMGAQNTGITQFYRIAMNRNGSSSTAGSISATYGGDNAAASANAANLNSGLYVATRTTASRLDLYRNGISITNNTTTPSVLSPTVPIFVMVLNVQGGSATLFLDAGSSVAGYHLDKGLSNTDSLTLYNILQNYHTALGRNI